MYSSPVLDEERRRSTTMMAELFDFFLAYPDRLPDPYREMAAGEAPHRVICDYIAGMTDAFFHRTYDQVLSATPPRP